MEVFRTPLDHRRYIRLMRRFTRRWHVKILSWCLMPNHVHLVMSPSTEDGLALAVGETHRRYTLHVNGREGVRGHLFQERFHSYPIETDTHLLAVVRYVERNPLRAGFVRAPEDYPWCSARHRILGTPDPLLSTPLPLSIEAPWKEFLSLSETSDELGNLRIHSRTGRPLGTPEWLHRLEDLTHRKLTPRKRGWPPGRPREPGKPAN